MNQDWAPRDVLQQVEENSDESNSALF